MRIQAERGIVFKIDRWILKKQVEFGRIQSLCLSMRDTLLNKLIGFVWHRSTETEEMALLDQAETSIGTNSNQSGDYRTGCIGRN